MFYVSLLIYGAITMAAEWKQVAMSTRKKILYTFTFPLFMFTYIPISAVALVKKVEWKPICHGNTTGELIPSKGQGRESFQLLTKGKPLKHISGFPFPVSERRLHQ